MSDESERRDVWRREQENRQRRLELERRLEEILRARGGLPWSEPRADADETVEVKLTLEEVAELVGALSDAWNTFGLREDVHAHESYRRELKKALRGARNSDRAEVLRRFGLVDGNANRARRERLELARFYWGLINGLGPPIDSPRRREALDTIAPAPRAFGALHAIDDGNGAAGRAYRAPPVSDVEAVRIVRAELGCPSDDAARERLLAARDAVRQARREGLVVLGISYPLPPDDFPIPDPAKLAKP